VGGPEINVGQIEVDQNGLAELKKRRERLLALGVSEKQAPAEPDAVVGKLPASWTTKKWFLCPPNIALPADRSQKSAQITTPTEVKFVGRMGGLLRFELKSGPEGSYLLYPGSFIESCSARPTKR
jgi:hypothetical protein